MKTIPAGTYLFKESGADFSSGLGSVMTGTSSDQLELVYNNIYYTGSLTFGDAMGSNTYRGKLTSTPYYNVYENDKWGLLYAPGSSMPSYTYPDDTTEIRTVLITNDLSVSDLVYEVFWNNTEHEGVRLETPAISFEKGIIAISNIDINADFINIYKRIATTGSPSDYQKIASISSSESTYDVENVTIPNRSYDIVCTCYSSSQEYIESEFSNAIYFNRNSNFELIYSFTLDKNNDYIGFLSVSANATIFDKNYEYTVTNVTEHNYNKSFIIPIYDDSSENFICDVSTSLKQGYYSKDGTTETFNYSATSGDSFTVDFVRNSVQSVPPYVIKLFNGDILAYQFVSTFVLDGLSVLKDSDTGYDYTITFYTQDGARNEYKLKLDKHTMLKGVSKTPNNLFPEYPLGFDNNIEPISTATAFYIITDYIFDGGIDMNLYKNSSENNRVNKSKYLENVGILNGILRDECNVVNPVIIIEYHKVPDFNYIYIPAFKRYYFLTKFEFVRKNAYRLFLHVDVLMSYKDGVKKLECLVARNEYKYNKEINSKTPQTSRVNYEYIKIPLPSVTDKIVFTNMDDVGYGVNPAGEENYGIPCFSIVTAVDSDI